MLYITISTALGHLSRSLTPGVPITPMATGGHIEAPGHASVFTPVGLLGSEELSDSRHSTVIGCHLPDSVSPFMKGPYY